MPESNCYCFECKAAAHRNRAHGADDLTNSVCGALALAADPEPAPRRALRRDADGDFPGSSPRPSLCRPTRASRRHCISAVDYRVT